MKHAAFLISALLFTSLAPAGASSKQRDLILADCANAASCLERLESVLPAYGAIDNDEAERIATALTTRFGDEAKSVLLDWALDANEERRRLARLLLWAWDDWREEDIPRLRDIVRRDPNNGAARGLGDIGTPEAIDILVEAIPYAHRFSTPAQTLTRLGPEVLHRFLPALMVAPNYDESGFQESPGWLVTQDIIAGFGADAMIVADEWIKIALNRREDEARRLAALRGLAALNGYLRDKAAALRPLAKDRNKEISMQASITLVAAGDPTMARVVAKNCMPENDPWDAYPESQWCLYELSKFGSNGAGGGDLVLPFLESESPLERALGIETLGIIGYQDAIPKIEPFLASPDWRLVYASVRGLGQLQSFESVVAIEAAGRNHWFPPLGAFARVTADKIKRRQPYGGRDFNDFFGEYGEVFKDERCEWEVWTYEGVQIVFDDNSHHMGTAFALGDGDLVATDMGEFGGSLEWRPDAGEPVKLVPDNSGPIFAVEGGFLSIHALAHMTTSYGYATFASRNADGGWTVREVARFPGAAHEVIRLNDDVFAAKSAGYAVIFSPDGITAVADCDWRADPLRMQ